ncbi:MAG: glycoside hydrolase family 88 protein [Treponema sp.]|jgi:unsaturated rhamnogalacturonyl hydrolase|nr:glycoside hydrolase family 88 protein [Treponema sp.]
MTAITAGPVNKIGDAAKPISQRMALSVMSRYKPEHFKWHYEHGLVLQSIYAVGKKYGASEYCRYVKDVYDALVSEDGIATYHLNEYNLDQINAGKVLFDLYRDFGEEKYRRVIELLRDQLRTHPRTRAGGFWHKEIYPYQMWLDGLYMQGPFYARYGAEYGGPDDIDDVCNQFIIMEAKARDKCTGLLYHGWNEDRKQLWANPVTGCSPHFWGRAMGWYCMAVLDTLDCIPPTYQKQIDELKAIANRLVLPILKYQDKESGLWYQVLDKGRSGKNYLESSASAMFTCFLFKVIRTGILPKADAALTGEAALAAYEGMLKHKVKEDPSGSLHLEGICRVAGLGGNPYRDGSFEYYVQEPPVTDDFKGIGPFILASLERENS